LPVFNARFDALEHRFDAIDANLSALEFEILSDVDRRFRAQTWALVTALFAMFTVLITAMGVILAVAT
jgi:hypothetical protein